MRQSHPIRDWFRQWVSQVGTVALAMAIGCLSVMAAIAWYLAPERAEADVRVCRSRAAIREAAGGAWPIGYVDSLELRRS
jgi:hypothetical protein